MYLPHICFINQISKSSEKQPLRQQLIQTITSAMPKIHNKVQEINLRTDEISKLTQEISEFQKQTAQNREQHLLEVEKSKKEFEEKECRQKPGQAERK